MKFAAVPATGGGAGSKRQGARGREQETDAEAGHKKQGGVVWSTR